MATSPSPDFRMALVDMHALNAQTTNVESYEFDYELIHSLPPDGEFDNNIVGFGTMIVSVTAVDGDGSVDVLGHIYALTVKNPLSGNATIVGVPTLLHNATDVALAGATVVFGVSGDNLTITVTGVADTLLTWSMLIGPAHYPLVFYTSV